MTGLNAPILLAGIQGASNVPPQFAGLPIEPSAA